MAHTQISSSKLPRLISQISDDDDFVEAREELTPSTPWRIHYVIQALPASHNALILDALFPPVANLIRNNAIPQAKAHGQPKAPLRRS